MFSSFQQIKSAANPMKIASPGIFDEGICTILHEQLCTAQVGPVDSFMESCGAFWPPCEVMQVCAVPQQLRKLKYSIQALHYYEKSGFVRTLFL